MREGWAEARAGHRTSDDVVCAIVSRSPTPLCCETASSLRPLRPCGFSPLEGASSGPPIATGPTRAPRSVNAPRERREPALVGRPPSRRVGPQEGDDHQQPERRLRRASHPPRAGVRRASALSAPSGRSPLQRPASLRARSTTRTAVVRRLLAPGRARPWWLHRSPAGLRPSARRRARSASARGPRARSPRPRWPSPGASAR